MAGTNTVNHGEYGSTLPPVSSNFYCFGFDFVQTHLKKIA